jgi:hypothetical protein
MVCCLAVDWAAPAWFWLAAAAHGAAPGADDAGLGRGSAQTAVMLGALDHVPQGARIASAVVVTAAPGRSTISSISAPMPCGGAMRW